MISPIATNALQPEVDPVQWGAQVKQAFHPLELIADRAASFRASVRLNVFSRCRIAEVKASAHTVAMRTAACDDMPKRHIKILWQLEGAGRLEQAGHALELPSGHWTVYEATRPYELNMSDNAAFVAFLCEIDAHDGLDFLNRRVGGRAVPTAGGAAVALAALEAMNSAGNRLDPSSRSAAADFVSTLLCQEIRFSEGSNEAARRRTQDAILREAQQFVRKHLDRPDLSPDQIASALNICRRTLYHAFESTGETPQALVQRMRLERCRDVLSDDCAGRASITQLALEYGFSDPAYFTRLFRQRFGRTPSQFRAASQQLHS